MNTNRVCCIGASGSGKSTLMNKLFKRYKAQKAFTYLVVVSRDEAEKSPFAAACTMKLELTTDLAKQKINWEKMLLEHGSVYIELTALDANDQLDKLSRVIMFLENTLVIFDEAHKIVTASAGNDVLELYTRGRKKNINIITIMQSVMQRPHFGINPVVISECTCLVTFIKTDPNEVKKSSELFPELGRRVADLKTTRDGAPEYAVKDMITGRCLLFLRSGELDISAGVGAM